MNKVGVVPAKAGIQSAVWLPWAPAFAGVTQFIVEPAR
jgi:hypothetical protein